MSEKETLSMNFGGIDHPDYSAFDFSRILILPVSDNETLSPVKSSAAAIIEASHKIELYEEETDSEVYKIGIHTLEEFNLPGTFADSFYEHSKKLLQTGKFLTAISGEHSIIAPIIRAHAEKFHNLSVLHVGARIKLLKDLRIPSVQVGIRSISADTAREIDAGLPSKIFWARDIVGRTSWIDESLEFLTDNVYLTIDAGGIDPGIMPATRTPEPGGLGWYELLKLIRKLSKKRRVVGMNLVGYLHFETHDAPAFLCAKLIYKSLAYIFNYETPKVVGRRLNI